MRLFKKNQVKRPRNASVTTTPRIWTGGSEAAPMPIGASPMLSDTARVSPPTVIGGNPRNMAPRPMVAMITAMIGRPSSGLSTMRSSAKLNATMMATAAPMATRTGILAASAMAAMKPANITNSPCAKLMASVAL